MTVASASAPKKRSIIKAILLQVAHNLGPHPASHLHLGPTSANLGSSSSKKINLLHHCQDIKEFESWTEEMLQEASLTIAKVEDADRLLDRLHYLVWEVYDLPYILPPPTFNVFSNAR
ncbi:hypothetical protein GOP47_0009942 [Adiantum capillus-veneris]|uniref:Uncharacterized protein n=1 Tax=Adiantum capillus-veneris TaxID=13818 RepID=A0A9D4ZJZ0_ADICA|nr:hypothetical protein GOP47_0009942 [Adiantum capillus-veneris]